MSDNKSLKNKFLSQHYNKLFTDIMRYVFLLAFSYILLYPMLYIIVNSLKNPADYFNPTIQWVLRRVTFVNIKMAFLSMDYLNALKSTAINGIITALIQVAACSVAAYGLARFNFKGKTFLKASMILSILIPTAMVMIPTYINYKNLGILGTPLAFWLPSATCVGVNCGNGFVCGSGLPAKYFCNDSKIRSKCDNDREFQRGLNSADHDHKRSDQLGHEACRYLFCNPD